MISYNIENLLTRDDPHESDYTLLDGGMVWIKVGKVHIQITDDVDRNGVRIEFHRDGVPIEGCDLSVWMPGHMLRLPQVEVGTECCLVSSKGVKDVE
jgi:hypothetical protein